jgi:hypothetical protein
MACKKKSGAGLPGQKYPGRRAGESRMQTRLDMQTKGFMHFKEEVFKLCRVCVQTRKNAQTAELCKLHKRDVQTRGDGQIRGVGKLQRVVCKLLRCETGEVCKLEEYGKYKWAVFKLDN